MKRLNFWVAVKKIKIALLVSMLAAIGGCTSLSNQTAPERYDPEKDYSLESVKTGGFKLSAARVVWESNPKLGGQLIYGVPGRQGEGDGKASPEMIASYVKAVKQLNDFFEKNVVGAATQRLEQLGVNAGDEYRIVLKPTRASYVGNVSGFALSVSVSLFNKDGQLVWSDTIEAEERTLPRHTLGYLFVSPYSGPSSLWSSDSGPNVLASFLLRLQTHFQKAELVSR